MYFFEARLLRSLLSLSKTAKLDVFAPPLFTSSPSIPCESTRMCRGNCFSGGLTILVVAFFDV